MMSWSKKDICSFLSLWSVLLPHQVQVLGKAALLMIHFGDVVLKDFAIYDLISTFEFTLIIDK
jgi:hypothetical protein